MSSKTRNFLALTESSFSGIPICRIVFSLVKQHPDVRRVRVVHCKTQNDVCRMQDVVDQETFLIQAKKGLTKTQKVLKWLRLLGVLVKLVLFDRQAILYSDSPRTVACATLFNVLFFANLRICLHQFESLDWTTCGRADRTTRWLINKFHRAVAIVVIPEKQRAAFFSRHFPKLENRVVVCPNTTLSRRQSTFTSNSSDEKITVLHVGSLGGSTYWREVLRIAESAPHVQFDFVGRVNSQFSDEAEGLSNVCCRGMVPHHDLPEYYNRARIGLILYKPNELNTRLAAPNKLYEYWSFGVPVVAPTLDGLKTQVTREFSGHLIDFAGTNFVRDFHDALVTLDGRGLKEWFDESMAAEVLLPKLVSNIVGNSQVENSDSKQVAAD